MRAYTLRRLTFLPKRIFDRFFFKESGTEHHPGEVLRFVCKLSTSSQQNGHHQRHTIHQPQQAPTDNISEDTAARSSAELPTPRKQAILLHIQANFSEFPGLVLFRPARHCAALLRCAIENINTNLYSIDKQQKRDSNITLFVF